MAVIIHLRCAAQRKSGVPTDAACLLLAGFCTSPPAVMGRKRSVGSIRFRLEAALREGQQSARSGRLPGTISPQVDGGSGQKSIHIGGQLLNMELPSYKAQIS